jgi:hypothetical protein
VLDIRKSNATVWSRLDWFRIAHGGIFFAAEVIHNNKKFIRSEYRPSCRSPMFFFLGLRKIESIPNHFSVPLPLLASAAVGRVAYHAAGKEELYY